MNEHCVVAIYRSLDSAKEALRALDIAGIPRERVSMVTHSVDQQIPAEEALQTGDQAESNAAAAAGVGSAVGLLLGAPLLAIPGIGPVLWAGPIAMSLTGALVGGFLGAMSGWGVHADHIRQYEQEVKDGNMLVVVNSDPQVVARAKNILDETDARSVHLHIPTADESPEVDDRF